MALVTVQRSPSVAGSPQCSNSDAEAEEDDGGSSSKTTIDATGNECFFAGKGTALVLALKDIPQYTAERRLSTDSTKSTNSTQSNNSDIQQHLQSMFYLLNHEETLKMAVKLESQRPNRTRYLVIASRCCFRSTTTTERKTKIMRNNSAKVASNSAAAVAAPTQRQLSVDSSMLQRSVALEAIELMRVASNAAETTTEKRATAVAAAAGMSASATLRLSAKCADAEKNAASGDSKCSEGGFEESCLLGIDCNERTTIGLVVPILADTTIHLDGDGGFSVAVYGKTHIFKPVSVQAMWSALQTLHKVSQKARENNFYPSGPSHDWLTYYESRIASEQSCLNEWNAMDSIESRRPPSPDAIRNKPTEKEETESVIKMKLKEIMMSVDLDEVTSKYIRGRLEEHLDMDLGEYKSFIDEEMLIILGQMDAPTEIFDHVYLGSEWNASNLEELQKNGVRHILNVTREIDNFFPGMFDYFNVRVYDDEKTNLLKHWDNTFRYINRAKDEGSKVLVHCKMGVSRSASVVIAYAMKAYNWEFQQALQHVKERRNCIKPNKNFLNQLETYRGMLDAMKNKEKLQRSKSETNLKSTKDARLLPGSEPTPLIQALNQTKSKSAGNGVSGDSVGGICDDGSVTHVENTLTQAGAAAAAAACVEVSGGIVSVSRISTASDQKQRRLMRRSSSTSPKSIGSHAASIIAKQQQSQSLENLTPERSVADEPKNVRFPGSNGENYSVTQNQVLHIQKHTPPPPPPPPPPTTTTSMNVAAGGNVAAGSNSAAVTCVKTIVSGLESNQERKTVDDRKALNLQFARSVSMESGGVKLAATASTTGSTAAEESDTAHSPVWTSSAKLITQTSTMPTTSASATDAEVAPLRSSLRLRRDTNSSCGSGDMFSSQLDNVFDKEEQQRKTQTPMLQSSSNSSLDSAATANNHCEAMTGVVRQRELPTRHASWGSGDNRCSLPPIRNSSWGHYDANRNSFQYGSSAATAAAIIEGQIHELHMTTNAATQRRADVGTVKRTKQKLEECTVLKKLCQENGSGTTHRRSANLYRSQSAAAATRSRFPQRCNSEEIVGVVAAGTAATGGVGGPHCHTRRSDGSKPLQNELFSASAPETYCMSDITNENAMPCVADIDGDDTVLLRHASAIEEQQRSAGNVQILKKNFEAKAGNSNSNAAAATIATSSLSASSTSSASCCTSSTAKKGHQSLPSSPVAQHAEMSSNATATTTTANCYCNGPVAANDAAQQHDRNVKGLVHKYQTSSSSDSSSTVAAAAALSATASSSSSAANTVTSSSASSYSSICNTTSNSSLKTRPRSYYETRHFANAETSTPPSHHKTLGRPPQVPLKNTCSSSSSSSTSSASSAAVAAHAHAQTMTESILAHQQQHRRVQQHGKTHPLARLSLPKQSFNAAAYNTM